MARDITQNIILKTSLQDGISKSVKQAAQASTAASNKIGKNIRKNVTGFKRLTASVRTFRNTLATIKAAVPGLAALAAVVGGGMGFISAARSAAAFADSMSEVSTLVDTSIVDIDDLREGVLGISNAFGSTTTDVAKGLYQTISSGAVDAADSIEFLTKAQTLAVAGVSTTEQAVDVISTALNAYSLGIEDVTRVSDVLFETVKQGKTTIPELAQNLGSAIPIAATLGVSLDEVTAAVAAMTKGGISTDKAVTSLRGAMAALIKPSSEVMAILASEDIDISKARIETEGFVAVLGDLERAFGDQPEVIAQIIPNIRALTGVLALTGNQANEFRRILEGMADIAGVTGDAFDTRMSDPAFRAQKNIQNLKNAFIAMGNSIINSFNEMIERAGGIEHVADNLEAVGKAIGAVFGVVTNKLGDILGDVDDVVAKMGGAEKFGDTVAGLLTAIGNAFGAFASLATDLMLGVVELILDLNILIAETLGLFGADDDPLFGVAKSAEGAREQIALLEEEIVALSETQDNMLKQSFSGYEDAVSEFTDKLIDTPGEIAAGIEKAQNKIKALQAQLAVGAFTDTGLSLGEELALDLQRLQENGAEAAKIFSEIGAANAEVKEELAKPVDVAVLQAFQRSNVVGGIDSFKERAKEAFQTVSQEVTDFAKQLDEITLALEGNEQAILDYEITQLRLTANAITSNAEEVASIEEKIKAIESLKQAEIDDAAAAARSKVVVGLLADADKYLTSLREQHNEELRLAEDRAMIAQQAQDILNQLGRANARTFEDRLFYERELLNAEKERQLVQLQGAENFEAISQRINDAYAIQLEGLRPENLEGFAGMARGAKEAMEEFVIFAKDDAAFAFDAMSSALGSFSQGFGRAFVQFASGAKSASAAFTAFAQSFIQQIAEMFAARAAAQLLGAFIGGFTAGPSSGELVSFQQANVAGGADGGVVGGGLSDVQAFADGGIVAGGLGRSTTSNRAAGGYSDVQAFANGGIASGGLSSSPAISIAAGGYKDVQAFADGGIASGGLSRSPASSGASGGFKDIQAFAKGGIAIGGLGAATGIKDIHAYANGGAVVKKPHFAVIGEGQYNEAVVPLPDGRSIPVEMKNNNSGGGGGDTIISPTIQFSVQSLDPRGTVEVLLEPEVQKSLRAAIADSLTSGSDQAFSSAVKQA